jgi:hypothetical protein
VTGEHGTHGAGRARTNHGGCEAAGGRLARSGRLVERDLGWTPRRGEDGALIDKARTLRNQTNHIATEPKTAIAK